MLQLFISTIDAQFWDLIKLMFILHTINHKSL